VCPAAAPIGGFFITTKADRSRCSTRRLATIADMSFGVVHALPAIEPEREGERVRQVVRRCGREAFDQS
jgi:hypothetical protein